MANICSNYLSYSGVNAKDVFASINEMRERSVRLGEGVVPKEVMHLEDMDRYFFDIETIEEWQNDTDDFVSVSFWTKWTSPLDELRAWAKAYPGRWYIVWEERGSSDIGRMHIDEDGTERLYQLTSDMIDAIEQDDDTDVCTYGNQEYECFDDAVEQALNDLEAKSHEQNNQTIQGV